MSGRDWDTGADPQAGEEPVMANLPPRSGLRESQPAPGELGNFFRLVTKTR
jgi:hypothetical protein